MNHSQLMVIQEIHNWKGAGPDGEQNLLVEKTVEHTRAAVLK